MIMQYRLLSSNIRAEMMALERVTVHAEKSISFTTQSIDDISFYISSAALDLHGFYSGIERLFEQIAHLVDQTMPKGSHWHTELLTQMTRTLPGVRPPILELTTRSALDEYLGFRHRVRNLYTYDLRTQRVIELVKDMRPTFLLVQRDLLAFADFLDQLSTADEG